MRRAVEVRIANAPPAFEVGAFSCLDNAHSQTGQAQTPYLDNVYLI